MSSNDTRQLVEALDYLVDSQVGIIHNIGEVKKQSGAPEFFHFYGLASNTRAFTSQKNFAKTGGASTNRATAMAKAIGEAIERYCSAIYDPLEIPIFSYETAPFPCADPKEFALYDKVQYDTPGFQFVPFERDTPVRWIPSVDPLNSDVLYLPASMIYVPYYYQLGTGESPIIQPISTGLACHSNPFKTAITAICEVIERDAFMITWLGMLPRPRILVKSLSKANIDLVSRFERAGYSISIFDITMDTRVPTILSVARSFSPELPPLAFAASASLNPEESVRKSLEELEHTRYYLQTILEGMPRLVPEPNHENIIDQKGHLNFWCDHTNASLANFIFSSDKQVNFDEIENLETGDPKMDLDVLLQKVHAIGHRALLCDVTTQDILGLGFRVMRAVIPGFHPLFVGHALRALGGYRLWNIPQKLGYRAIKYGDDNPAPHPYP